MSVALERDTIPDGQHLADNFSIQEPAAVAQSALQELLVVPGVVAAVLRPTDLVGPVAPLIAHTIKTPLNVQAALTADPFVAPDGSGLNVTLIPMSVMGDVVANLTLVHDRTMNPAAAREQVNASGALLTLAATSAGFRPAPAVFNRFGVDALTGRPNRAFALKHLAQRLDEDHDLDFAVLFCDLDGFKTVNDTFGHPVGDDLLRQVAQRLAKTLPPGDVLARLGGDEFLAIVHAPTQADAQRQAMVLINSLDDDFTVGIHTVSVGVSIGIALPVTSMNADELICAADIAMYEAKKLRSGASALYTPALHAQTEKRRLIEHDLRHAIGRNELSIMFQPVSNLRAGTLAGVEALLRWTHPILGEVGPRTFIPLAEKSRLIDDLGRFALTSAVAEFVRLKEQHGHAAPKYVAVNVSRWQLDADDLVPHLATLVDQFGIQPSELHLELTESAALLDATSARMTLTDITTLGIGLDIDDFGVGYSSLAYLTHLPSLSAIKVDSSMIWQLSEEKRSRVTVRALIALAHELGLLLLAEGIETTWQRDWLTANGCDLGQGFALGVPMTPAALSDLLRSARQIPSFTLPWMVK